MSLVKRIVEEKKTFLYLCFCLLLLVIPFIKNQILAGVSINCIFLLSTMKYGFKKSIPLAFIPSSIAFAYGMLPLLLMPMIPFIILGNITLMGIFSLFQTRSKIISITVAALIKYFILATACYYIFSGPSFVFGIIQTITAFSGGVLALAIARKK